MCDLAIPNSQGPPGAPGEPGDQGPDGPKVRMELSILPH